MIRVVIEDLAQKSDNSFANLAVREAVQASLTNNSVYFNHKVRQGTNLMDYSQREELYKKSPEQRKIANRLKNSFTKNSDETIKSFINSEIPNWNIKFTLLN
jgi:predicted DNA-binding protein YlxM (UPF0122 family)